MTKIINDKNNGNKKGAKVGVVNIRSANVSPTTIVAAPTPALVDVDELNLYDWFNADQTSADTDEIDLPDAAPVGTRFTIYCLDVVEIRTETDTGEINGVGSKGYTAVALDLLDFTKVTATGWLMSKTLEADGVVSQPEPVTA